MASDGGHPIAAGRNVTPKFPGAMDGPVEVKCFSNSGHSTAAKCIASQRSVFGPSFEEVPGKDKTNLHSYVDWNWYDQQSAGARNWVLVTNPSATDTITATVTSTDQGSGVAQTASQNIAPSGRWYGTFPGKMGGPVHAAAVKQGTSTSEPIITWNGYFNEVWGQ